MKIKCIINEKSARGRDKKLTALLEAKFADHDVDFLRTAYPGHATRASRLAVKEGFDIIVAVGGDGTVNEVVNGVIPSQVAVGIIPTGTANDLADQINIPNDVEKACDIIIKGSTRRIDSICVNGWHFITVGGLGLPADAVINATALKKCLPLRRRPLSIIGSRIYVLGLLLAFISSIGRGVRTRMSCNCSSFTSKTYSIIIANQAVLGKRFKVCPDAVNDDGCLDLFTIEAGWGLKNYTAAVAGTTSGRHVNMSNVHMHRTHRVRIVANKKLSFFGDGNIGCEGTEFDISVIPGAVTLLVP
ncbi:MAG: hypothetical protein CVT49_07735 [candidate division Zixibacteria bacterium HGW-Zixibacteria-1]|nr:MAG: hypothetical protein CVT49_07735 [candidate division Zixibacteria bacterium HGW-Zixibacteria-1]